MVTTNGPTTVPVWLKPYLQPAQLSTIAAAIHQAEATTSGEIVPMVVRRSAGTGHVTVILVLAAWLLYFGALAAGWIQPHAMYLHLLPLVLASLLAVVLGQLPLLQRWLTSDQDLARQVYLRAQAEFFAAGLNKTANATGILLFVSLMERRAVVLADQTIATKVTPETWETVVSLILAQLRRRDLGRGYAEAIAHCGSLAQAHFPIAADDRNELKDALIIKE